MSDADTPCRKGEGDGIVDMDLDIDWESFVDMDVVGKALSYPIQPEAQVLPSLVKESQHTTISPPADSRNFWQAPPRFLLAEPQQQDIHVAVPKRFEPCAASLAGTILGGESRCNAHDAYTSPLHHPPHPPSRQMTHTTDQVLDSTMSDEYANLQDDEMRWLSDIGTLIETQNFSGLDVGRIPGIRNQIQEPQLIAPPCSIDPALTDNLPLAPNKSSLYARRRRAWETESQSPEYSSPSRAVMEKETLRSSRSSTFSSPTPPLRPNYKSQSRAGSTTASPQPEKQGPCLTCGKNYRSSTSPGRCGRCGIKFERGIAGPPRYELDESVPDLEAARSVLFPVFLPARGRRIDGEEVMMWEEVEGAEDMWVQRFLVAICTPVISGGDDGEEGGGGGGGEGGTKDTTTTAISTWAMNQQKTFNQKAKMERQGDFSPRFLTARLRALWWEILLFHGGGSGGGGGEGRSLYPVGGDSSGYVADLEVGFRERLEAVESVLKVDKRTVMDVVEGRGVSGFVGNPWGFHRRKGANNGGNVRKREGLREKRQRGGDEDGSL